MNKIILSILLVMLILPSVSAFEFDNVKQYNPGTETVIVKNSFLGIPTTEVAELKLLTPKHNVIYGTGYQRVAEIEINNVGEYDNALAKLDFYKVYFGLTEKPSNYDYKYLTYVDKIVDNNIYVCENTATKFGNQTVNTVCYFKKDGTKTIKVPSWETLDTSKPLPKGKITIGIYYYDVKTNEVIDWVPTYFGVEVKEWASFVGAVEADSYKSGQDDYFGLTGNVLGQQFKSYLGDFTLAGVSLYMMDSAGGAVSFQVHIKENTTNEAFGATLSENLTIDATILPDTADVNSGLWYNITMPSMNIVNNTAYWITGDNGVGSTPRWIADDAPSSYTKGASYISYDGGYHSGDFLFMVWGTVPAVSAPGNITTTLNSPINYFNTTVTTLTFNASSNVVDPANLTNATLYIWNSTGNTIIIDTTTLSGNVSVNTSWVETLTYDDVYKWNVRSCGFNTSLATKCNFANANFTFTLDTTAPVINILYPQNNSYFASLSNLSIDFNVSVTHIPGVITCWYYNGTGNTNINCNSNTTLNLSTLQGGYSTFTYYANDSLNNLASNSTTIFYNSIYSQPNYSNVIEGENSIIYLNITANRITTAYANLTYNNTIYSMSQLSNNGTRAVFYKIITAPFINSNSLINFTFNYSIDGDLFNTSYYNQTVYNIPALNISAGLCNANPVYSFDFKDEENGTALIGDLEYNFYYGLSNATAVRSFGRLTSTSNFSICTNSTISPNWTIGSGEIFYNVPGYAERRYYIFDNTVVTNITNITLYDLLNTAQTSFKLEVEDTSLNPYDNVYNRLLRWYPDQNEYKIVDMGKTDETGSTVIHVKSEDVDYRIGVYETNGTLIYLAQPIRMVCLASPCTYTLKISPGNTDYTSFLNVVYSLDYNETSGIWDFVYSDSTGKTSTMNLTVYRVTSTSVYPVCSNSITGAVGAISCNTSIFTDGMLRAEVYRSASPPVQIVQKVIQLYNSAFKGSGFGLFLSFLLGLPIILLLTMVSPIGAIVGGVISLIPAFYFGSINIGILGGIAVLAGITAHFLKRVS